MSDSLAGEARPGDGRRRERPLRLATVGVSSRRFCGVRDHATLLDAALAARGEDTSMHWLTHQSSGLGGNRSALARWRGALGAELAARKPDAVLFHYSVFDLSYRGLPLFVAPVTSALARTGTPVLAIVHELVYPWDIGGARGKVWAATQRLAAAALVRRSSGLLVTDDARADWLRTRRWLPRRPVQVAPVYSNLPAPAETAAGERAGGRIGVFGYAYENARAGLVLDALTAVRRSRPDARLELLGAPGEDSEAGRSWRALAAERGAGDALSFAGTLPAQQLSDALAACDVLLSIDLGGPSSRKGSLAGMLASGAPVVALDGRRRWQAFVDRDALRLVRSDASELADAIAALLADPAAARALGERGQRFHDERMSVAVTVAALDRLLDAVAI